jgi:hypothetical protein
VVKASTAWAIQMMHKFYLIVISTLIVYGVYVFNLDTNLASAELTSQKERQYPNQIETINYEKKLKDELVVSPEVALNQSPPTHTIASDFNYLRAKEYFDQFMVEMNNKSMYSMLEEINEKAPLFFYPYELEDAKDLASRYVEYFYAASEIKERVIVKDADSLDIFTTKINNLQGKIFSENEINMLVTGGSQFNSIVQSESLNALRQKSQ